MKINRDLLRQWHKEGKHQEIVNAIEPVPRTERDYELLSLYARALNNLERYPEALDVLFSIEKEGQDDALWHYRVGYSCYYLNNPEQAKDYLQKAIELGDTDEDTLMLLKACEEAIEAEENYEESGKIEFNPEYYENEEGAALEAHIKKYFGDNENVFHELVSPDIHVDIIVIDPTPERNYYTLCTLGMGAHRMHIPEEAGKYLERAELLICLPPDWNLKDTENEDCYWPMRWLTILARLPIEEDSYLGWGHTIPSGGQLASNTQLSTMLLVGPGAFPREAAECVLPSGDVVNFYQVVPLYDSETEFKLKYGTEELLEKFSDEDLEYVKLQRKPVV